jgi:hypothetical protein
MVAPLLLQDPAVKRWLAGTEPAWILLDRKSLEALNRPPRTPGSAIRLAADMSLDEIEGSAVARNALVLLRSASEGSGLGLTATGNLARRVVAEMRELMIWPDFDQAEADLTAPMVRRVPDVLDRIADGTDQRQPPGVRSARCRYVGAGLTHRAGRMSSGC